MKPSYLIIHHSAVSREANKKQFDAIKRNHIAKGWGNIAYHYFIEPSGRLEKGRPDDEVGTHCLAGGMNMKSLGICLAGNLQLEPPTHAQVYMLRDLLQSLTKKYQITQNRILGHREVPADTLCPGKMLDMNFVRNLTILAGDEK